MRRSLAFAVLAVAAVIVAVVWNFSGATRRAQPLESAPDSAVAAESAALADSRRRESVENGAGARETGAAAVGSAAGSVVDEAGTPVVGAIVEAWDAGAADPELGHAPCSTASGAKGRFALDCETSAPRVRVRARHAKFLPSKVYEIAPGVATLRLTLRSGGSLPVSILLPGSRIHGGFEVRFADESSGIVVHTLTWLSESGARTSLGVARIEASEQPAPDGASSRLFLDCRLPPATYAISVAARDAEDSLALVPHVVVHDARESSDSRVDPIDLRGVLHAICLRVVDERDLPIGAGWLQALDHGAGAPSKRSSFRNGRACFYSRTPIVDVLVGADGHQTAKLAAVSSDRRVVLLRALAYDLNVTGVAAVASPAVLRAVLVPSGVFQRDVGTVWTFDTEGLDVGAIERMAEDAPFLRAVDVPADGKVVLGAPERGTFDVRFFVAAPQPGGTRTSIAEVDVATRPTVEIGDERASGSVDLDPRSVADALARLSTGGR